MIIVSPSYPELNSNDFTFLEIFLVTLVIIIIIIIIGSIVPFGGRQVRTSIRGRINPLFNVTPLDGPINVSYSTSANQVTIKLMIMMRGVILWMN